MYSKIGLLIKNDLVRGVIMAVLGAVLSFLYSSLQNGWGLDWSAMGLGAMLAGISYLLKNLFSNESGKFAGKI